MIRLEKCSPKVIFYCLFIILMALCDLFEPNLPGFFGRIDEIFFVFCLCLLALYSISYGRIGNELVLLLILVLIGVYNNYYAGVQTSLNVIILDLAMFLKPYIVLIATFRAVSSKEARQIKCVLSGYAKLFLVVLAAVALISRVVYLPVRSTSGSYIFFARIPGTVSWWSLIFMALIYQEKTGVRIPFYFLTLYIIYETRSGLGMFSIVAMALYYLFVEKQKGIKVRYVFLAIPILVYLGREEINTYILNADSPRSILFYFAYVTAKAYFPFGSGFGTYGTMEAIAHYSKLYVQYGFESLAGMNRLRHSYLMDNYHPSLIAQFGVAGLSVWVVLMVSLIKMTLRKAAEDVTNYSVILFLFMIWMVAGIGFNTGGMCGCTMFMLVALFSKYPPDEKSIKVQTWRLLRKGKN